MGSTETTKEVAEGKKKLLSYRQRQYNNGFCLPLTHPWRFHDIIELQFINELSFSDVRVNIDLVCQNQHGSGSNASVVEQFVQLLLCRA
jgi:hypothetical protein